jgi:hypothetical protein
MGKVTALCNSCKRVTNHVVLAEYKNRGSTSEDDIQWWATYQIIQCSGCDDISFKITSSCTEDYDSITGKFDETVVLYPDRTNGREPIDGYDEFPIKTKRIYLETLKALNNQTPLLAAIGLRAIIESICLEKETKSDNLRGGIDELADLGLLSKKQAEFLHAHRFMGNEAAHEIVAPKPQHLIAAFDIAETLLKTIYILPNIADQLKRKDTSKSDSD